MADKLIIIFVYGLFGLPLLQCYITRLSCKIHANFTSQPNTYMKGTSFQSIDNLTNRECVRACVGNTSCGFINFNTQNATCMLMNEPKTLQYLPSEDVTSYPPDYSPEKLVDGVNWGPYCKQIKPCGGEGKLCYDVCDQPKPYVCRNLVEITTNGVASQSNNNDASANRGIDNDYTKFSATNHQEYCWWKLDLQTVFPIVAIRFWKWGNKNYQITCGNDSYAYNNPILVPKIQPWNDGMYFSNNRVNYCRYVSVVYMDSVKEIHCTLYEIKVYSKET